RPADLAVQQAEVVVAGGQVASILGDLRIALGDRLPGERLLEIQGGEERWLGLGELMPDAVEDAQVVVASGEVAPVLADLGILPDQLDQDLAGLDEVGLGLAAPAGVS